ncbi:hypothetical protein [Trichothermofontia sp.]
MMQIGRFFSLQQGRVGQYLSPRVLVVRTPFRSPAAGEGATETCYVGFDRLSLAQQFAQRLALLDCRFQMGLGRQLPYPYEVQVFNPGHLARILARWERQTRSAAVNANQGMGDRAKVPIGAGPSRSGPPQLIAS